MTQKAKRTALGRQLAIAACLIAGLAGCQVDRPRSAWRASPADEPGMACPGRCRKACVPCPEYQPTVWEPWRTGPMAVRGNDQCAEPDPTWLNDLPHLNGANGVKASPETVPTPPAKPGDDTTSGLGDGFKLQPAASADAPKDASAPSNASPPAKPELGEGFKLDQHAPPIDHTGDEAKPPIKGLEPAQDKAPPADKPPPLVPEGDSTAPPASSGKQPGDTPFVPEPKPADIAPTAQPSLGPPPSSSN